MEKFMPILTSRS